MDEVTQDPQEGQEGQDPQPQSIDPRQALEIAAQAYGTTPDYLEGALRLQDENRRVADEMRRRQRDLEIREAKLEALAQERQKYAPPEPSYENYDPTLRPVFEELKSVKQMLIDERKERFEQQRMQEEARRRGEELHGHFEDVMRRLPSQNQVDPQRFFGAMEELWPDGPPPGISAERAVGITARYMGLNPAGGTPMGVINGFQGQRSAYSNPRAQIVVPSQGTGPTANDPAPGPDFGPQRAGESTEQYHNRLKRSFQESGFTASGLMQDKGRVSSG